MRNWTNLRRHLCASERGHDSSYVNLAQLPEESRPTGPLAWAIGRVRGPQLQVSRWILLCE